MKSRHLPGFVLVLAALSLGGGSASGTVVRAGGLQVISRPTGTGPIPHANVNEQSSSPQCISADGRYAVFSSPDDALSTEDDNHYNNIFVIDRTDGSVQLVSRADGLHGAAGNSDSGPAVISSDGRMVAFESRASNLDSAATGNTPQVYVRDLVAHTTKLVSRGGVSDEAGNAGSGGPSINHDGTRIAFLSWATNFASLGASQHYQIYVRDLVAGTTELVSKNDSGTAPANGYSSAPAISGDGSSVAFFSSADNLITGLTDSNHTYDVFVRRLGVSATTELVSRAGGAAGAIGNGFSTAPSINYDGKRIAFSSRSTNLDPDDTDTSSDVYVRDTSGTPTTTLVSRADGATGAVDNGDSEYPSISGDGKVIAFQSEADNLVPGAGVTEYGGHTYVRDLTGVTPTTSLVDRATGASGAISDLGAYRASVSRDGTKVEFETSSTNLTTPPGDADGYFMLVRDLSSAATAALLPVSGEPTYYSWSTLQAASRDGRFVTFMSDSDNLSTENNDRWWAVYRRDTLTNATVLVSRASGSTGAAADRYSDSSSISSDGSRVAFLSTADNLVPGDTNGKVRDCFVRDLSTNTTILVSRTEAGAPLSMQTSECVISGDGKRVAFTTGQSLDPADTDTAYDAYVRDLATNQTFFASRQNGAAGAGAAGSVQNPTLNENGTRVAFASSSALTSDPITNLEVYVRDLSAGTTALVSRANGAAGAVGDSIAFQPDIDASGTKVAFTSYAANLVAGDTNNNGDVFVRNLAAGTTTLVSRATGAAGAISNDGGSDSSISDDGSRVAFYSISDNLMPGDTPGTFDVFVRDLSAGTTAGVDSVPSNDFTYSPAISGNGHCVAFSSYSDGVDPSVGDTDVEFVYMRTIAGECPNDPPNTTITGSPAAATRSRTATITSSSNDSTATFQCALDGAAFAACGASYSIQGLADGTHTAQVRAVDPAGNVDATPASVTWSVDATPPKLTIVIPKQRLKKVLARGLRLRLRATEKATATARLRLKRRVVGSLAPKSIGTKPRTFTIRIHLSTKALRALRHARSVRLVLVVAARDTLGNPRTVRRTVKIRR